MGLLDVQLVGVNYKMDKRKEVGRTLVIGRFPIQWWEGDRFFFVEPENEGWEILSRKEVISLIRKEKKESVQKLRENEEGFALWAGEEEQWFSKLEKRKQEWLQGKGRKQGRWALKREEKMNGERTVVLVWLLEPTDINVWLTSEIQWQRDAGKAISESEKVR